MAVQTEFTIKTVDNRQVILDLPMVDEIQLEDEDIEDILEADLVNIFLKDDRAYQIHFWEQDDRARAELRHFYNPM